MRQHQSIRAAVRFALAATLTASFSIPGISYAAQSPANLGKVTVTGTRIKRTNVETAQPITPISRHRGNILISRRSIHATIGSD